MTQPAPLHGPPGTPRLTDGNGARQHFGSDYLAPFPVHSTTPVKRCFENAAWSHGASLRVRIKAAVTVPAVPFAPTANARQPGLPSASAVTSRRQGQLTAKLRMVLRPSAQNSILRAADYKK